MRVQEWLGKGQQGWKLSREVCQGLLELRAYPKALKILQELCSDRKEAAKQALMDATIESGSNVQYALLAGQYKEARELEGLFKVVDEMEVNDE